MIFYLNSMTKTLRNSFYAKYGYNFKNKEMREYFEANCREQGVEYKVNPNFSESDFNATERKNIALIREMENMTELINIIVGVFSHKRRRQGVMDIAGGAEANGPAA